MEITSLFIIGLLVISSIYGLWGVRVVFDSSYAKRVGNMFRKFYGVSNTGGADEMIYDRYARGLPAILLGFGLAILCIRSLLG